jgi:hypothetical protein
MFLQFKVYRKHLQTQRAIVDQFNPSVQQGYPTAYRDIPSKQALCTSVENGDSFSSSMFIQELRAQLVIMPTHHYDTQEELFTP